MPPQDWEADHNQAMRCRDFKDDITSLFATVNQWSRIDGSARHVIASDFEATVLDDKDKEAIALLRRVLPVAREGYRTRLAYFERSGYIIRDADKLESLFDAIDDRFQPAFRALDDPGGPSPNGPPQPIEAADKLVSLDLPRSSPGVRVVPREGGRRLTDPPSDPLDEVPPFDLPRLGPGVRVVPIEGDSPRRTDPPITWRRRE